ncbi:DUF3618 domain-containing protein [Spongiactinospora sp. TRM90649]|uniref:DUF3618 domain-containing protein n=1 Tax=Spongiactinospora sp. TRM90649 TaxID=3031114 RepID=UPI0023F859A5|nr:DUF3618 domain-containing protein [Spongiactinospora sp. TRM90649]MDF5752767.1 DUF3618 domain-containing protein [Spongiactinospora sp. TRM90649]
MMSHRTPGARKGKGHAATPEQLRAEVARAREDLGETVEALAAKADVRSRAQRRAGRMKAGMTQRARRMLHREQGAEPGGPEREYAGYAEAEYAGQARSVGYSEVPGPRASREGPVAHPKTPPALGGRPGEHTKAHPGAMPSGEEGGRQAAVQRAMPIALTAAAITALTVAILRRRRASDMTALMPETLRRRARGMAIMRHRGPTWTALPSWTGTSRTQRMGRAMRRRMGRGSAWGGMQSWTGISRTRGMRRAMRQMGGGPSWAGMSHGRGMRRAMRRRMGRGSAWGAMPSWTATSRTRGLRRAMRQMGGWTGSSGTARGMMTRARRTVRGSRTGGYGRAAGGGGASSLAALGVLLLALRRLRHRGETTDTEHAHGKRGHRHHGKHHHNGHSHEGHGRPGAGRQESERRGLSGVTRPWSQPPNIG